MKHVFALSVFIATCLLNLTVVAMEPERVVVSSERFKDPITFTKPVLTGIDRQLWNVIFSGCRTKNPEALEITKKLLQGFIAQGASLDAQYVVENDDATAGKVGLERSGFTPLECSIIGNNQAFTRILLQLGARTDAPSDMCSALHAAALNKNHKVIPLLVKEGNADVNAKDVWGQTPVFNAIYDHAFEVFEALCRLPGLDVMVQDNNGQTPLHYAVLVPNPSYVIIGKLLALGADRHIKDRLGYSAYEYARMTQDRQLIALFGAKQQSSADGWLADTIVARSAQNKKIKAQLKTKKKNKKRDAEEKNVVDSNGLTQQLPEAEFVGEETISPTKKLREDLERVVLENTNTRRALFDDEENGNQNNNIDQVEQMLRFDQRVMKWFDVSFLEEEKRNAKSAIAFAQSVYYHQLPEPVIACVLKHGRNEPFKSEKRDDIGTRYYLRGTMLFEDPERNPWQSGKSHQPGYYHCTMDSRGVIYHIGFDVTRDHRATFGAFLPAGFLRKVTYDSNIEGIKHQFEL